MNNDLINNFKHAKLNQTPAPNDLIANYNLPPFKNITIPSLDKSLTNALGNANQIISIITTATSQEKINQNELLPSWELLNNTIYPALYALHQVWDIVLHLQAVVDSKEIRNLQQKFQPQITEFYVQYSQNKQLYQYIKEIKHNQYTNLDPEAKKVIDIEMRDFFLGGVELNDTKQAKFKQISQELSKLSTKFEQNVLDATDSFSKLVAKSELDGVPEDVLQQLKVNSSAKNNQDNTYKITLQMPCYLPIMQYCTNRKLREELYYNYVTRASELNNSKFDNGTIIPKLLKLRQEKAQLLGLKDYTELSLYTKMANDSKEVLDFLYDLANKSKAQAEKDLQEVQQFAKTNSNIDTLEVWDIQLFSEKLMQHKYSYSNNELKQYFQLPTVLDGLFKLIYNLYKIEFKINPDVETWHKDVTTYDVICENNKLGTIYFDLFARQSKQSGAWMNPAQEQYVTDKVNQQTIVYLICNFQAPSETLPSLLTFDDVTVLFHEMGHALHHLLTKVSHFTIAGTNNVEWDAVEMPSQFMEYFPWNYDILKTLTKHVKTNEILPREFYNKMVNARYFQSGLQMLRQIEFSVFDILVHDQQNTLFDQYLELLNKVRSDIAVIFPPEYNRFPNSFSHIFGGGYAAGYYSYKWAEVLAADVFSMFDDAKISEYATLGKKLEQNILAKGGIAPMIENFTAFMGRKPQIDALLKYSGIQSY